MKVRRVPARRGPTAPIAARSQPREEEVEDRELGQCQVEHHSLKSSMESVTSNPRPRNGWTVVHLSANRVNDVGSDIVYCRKGHVADPCCTEDCMLFVRLLLPEAA